MGTGGQVDVDALVHTAPERAASITDVPLTHKQQKSVFTKCFNHVRDYKTAVKNGRVLQPYSYIERKTRAATRSTVPYGRSTHARTHARTHALTLFVRSFVRSFRY